MENSQYMHPAPPSFARPLHLNDDFDVEADLRLRALITNVGIEAGFCIRMNTQEVRTPNAIPLDQEHRTIEIVKRLAALAALYIPQDSDADLLLQLPPTRAGDPPQAVRVFAVGTLNDPAYVVISFVSGHPVVKSLRRMQRRLQAKLRIAAKQLNERSDEQPA